MMTVRKEAEGEGRREVEESKKVKGQSRRTRNENGITQVNIIQPNH